MHGVVARDYAVLVDVGYAFCILLFEFAREERYLYSIVAWSHLHDGGCQRFFWSGALLEQIVVCVARWQVWLCLAIICVEIGYQWTSLLLSPPVTSYIVGTKERKRYVKWLLGLNWSYFVSNQFATGTVIVWKIVETWAITNKLPSIIEPTIFPCFIVLWWHFPWRPAVWFSCGPTTSHDQDSQMFSGGENSDAHCPSTDAWSLPRWPMGIGRYREHTDA